MLISKEGINAEELQANRVFLLPLGRLAKKLGIELDPYQIAMVNGLDTYRFCVGGLARRSGKTRTAAFMLIAKLLEPNSRCVVVTPRYNLSQILWDMVLYDLKRLGLEIEKINSRDRVVHFVNGSVFTLGSFTQPDSCIGVSNDIVVLDEFAAGGNGAREVFELQLLPTLDKPNARCLMISTFRRKNFFYEFYKRGFDKDNNWFSVLATWRDNPRMTEEVLESLRQAMSKAKFAQEMECSVEESENSVFPEPTVRYLDTPIVEQFAGMDFGFKDPTAIVLLSIRDDGIISVDKEYEVAGKTTVEHAEYIRENIPTNFLYGDSAAAQSIYDLSAEHDISIFKAEKNVLNGIELIKILLERGSLVISPDCYRTIEALQNATWDEHSEKLEHNQYIHIIDALRYAIYTHRHNFFGLDFSIKG